tara:strand:- start:8409 stop:10418 length:2010 start_codon:yes stop_codon:yes gene_type:complete
MKRLYFLFFAGFVIPFYSVAQVTSAAPDLNPDVSILREHIYTGIPNTLKNESWDRRAYRFADVAAGQISELINSGDIYTDQPWLEAYLNKVMEKVTPSELKADSIIHAYIIADAAYNAFMTPSGSMFVNIGLIAEAPDEAAIASVLAHEIAHYHKQHSLNGYVKAESGDFKNGLLRNKDESRFSIQNEFEADSLAMHWLKDAGYDLRSMERSFSIMFQLQRHYLDLSERNFEAKESSHPLPIRRLLKLKEFIAEQGDSTLGKPFIVSHALFRKLKNEARVQSLKNMMDDFRYTDGVEKAFKYHLLDPNNKTYIYYLLESIRKKCYMNSSIWSENFIAYRYHTTREVNDLKVKDEVTDHLFSSFNQDMLLLRDDEVEGMKTMFYWEEDPRFTTYEEAFIFYYRVARALDIDEALLSNALSITHDKAIRDTLLKEYLSKENVAYREFAENLLNESITAPLKDLKLTIVNDFNISIRQGDEDIQIVPTTEDLHQLKRKIDSTFLGDTTRIIAFMDDIMQDDPEIYRVLLDMERFSLLTHVSKGVRTKLHILEPRFWKVFQKFGVNEIEFINCRYLEARKMEKTKEAYIQALQTSYKDLFDQEKRTRDLQVLISRLRDNDNKRMKLKYRADHSLYFRDQGHPQIARFLQLSEKEFDEFASREDKQYLYGIKND